MVSADMVERMARQAHMAARERYPLLEPWEALTAERRAYQCRLVTHALGALTARDVLDLLDHMPDVVALPADPSPLALAELQEAAIADSGTAADARHRYGALLRVAVQPLLAARARQQPAG